MTTVEKRGQTPYVRSHVMERTAISRGSDPFFPLAPFVLSMLVVSGIVAFSAADASQQPQQTPTTGQDEEQDREKYLLRYKFRPNQFVHYTVEHVSTFTSHYPAGKEVAYNETQTQKHFRVVAIDERGNATLELMIDRVKMTARFNEGEKVVFDSQDTTKRPPQFQHVMNSVGKPTARFKFAPHGKLLKVVSSIAPQQDACGQGAAQQKEAANDASRNFLVVFPEEPIQVGDEWKDRIQACVNVTKKLKKQITLQRRYRLESVKAPLATISLRTSVLTPVNEPMIRAQLIQREPKGTIVFDIEQGRIVSRELKIDKVVVGAAGPKSSIRAVSLRREKLINGPAIAQKGSSQSAHLDAGKQ